MTELLPVLAAALAAGLIGSAHCLGMCGGMSALFAANLEIASLRSNLPKAATYNLGRIASYSVLGAIAAALGQGAINVLPALAGPVRIVAGLLIIAIGAQVAFNWRPLVALEKAGFSVWARLAPFARHFVPVVNLKKAAALGLLWGLLPCGLVYSALLLATSTSNALHGALVMFAFGIGTVPAMLLSGLSASRLTAFLGRNRLSTGVIIIVLGVATLAMPLTGLLDASGGSSHHHSTAL